jgi:hypothetical protein
MEDKPFKEVTVMFRQAGNISGSGGGFIAKEWLDDNEG